MKISPAGKCDASRESRERQEQESDALFFMTQDQDATTSRAVPDLRRSRFAPKQKRPAFASL
jgi:hypothetical protein